jgi:hypothetical protein
MSNVQSLNSCLLEDAWVSAEIAARPDVSPLQVLVMAAQRFGDDAKALACQ